MATEDAGSSSQQAEDEAPMSAVNTSMSTPNVAEVLALFKKSPVYMLEFTYTKRGESKPNVSVDDTYVVLLDSDEKKAAFKELTEKFNVTDVAVDEPNRVVKLTYTTKARNIFATWKDSVREDFRKSAVSLLCTWRMADIGLQAEKVQLQLKGRFADNGLVCELSDDKQKLLLLSSNPNDLLMKKAENFARKANPLSALSSEFQTIHEIKVSVYKLDITEVPADCIVSAVDQHLSFSGGVSAAIAKAAGQSMRDECKRRVEEKGPLSVSEVFASKGGKRWKNVLHVCGPIYPGPASLEECCLKLTDAIFNCLKTASELGHTTLALPAVSSGTFRVPIEISAKSYIDAIERFDEFAGKNKTTCSLTHILFNDIVEGRISEVQSRMETSLRVKLDEALRIVLIGRTGAGKSMTGNSIIKKKKKAFNSSAGLGSATHASKLEKTTFEGIPIEVVDTPGFFDVHSQSHSERMLKEILRSVALSLPGPHVFCVLFRADDRFTQIEIEVCRKIEELFSEELARYIIILFTHCPTEGDYSLDSLLEAPELPDDVHALLRMVEHRAVGIDNKGKPEDVHEQGRKLIQMALDLRAKNKADGKEFYTNALVGKCLQLLQSGEFDKKSLDDIKREIQQNPDGQAMATLTTNAQVIAKAQETKDAGSGCTIQ